jgi:hypothetical protein
MNRDKRNRGLAGITRLAGLVSQLFVTLIFTSTFSIAFGQTAATIDANPVNPPALVPPGVTIKSVKSEKITKVSSTGSVGAPGSNPNRLPLPTDGSAVRIERTELYVYSMEVTNGGDKAIKAVAWDFQFAEDMVPLVLAHHSFANVENIDRGQKKTLRFTTHLGPPKSIVVAAEKEGRPYHEYAQFQCILYADGSIWQQLSDSNPCQRLKRWIAQRKKAQAGLEDWPFNPN